MSRSNQQESLHAIAVASDPLRQGLVAFAVRHPGSFSRDDAAAALEITRTAAAFHLDKLAESGILEVEFLGCGLGVHGYRAALDYALRHGVRRPAADRA